ncbi:LHFPL tetraspan subfamily member 2a protein-like [Lytechinus pictus]|uniref:LHFPL tetraspan subfamily member 2a protein-like n=1 Tax=Lytechinus pictus TaxID=7653 RepID=UPI00240D1BB3|nr:LHFPL tetraspan subfamily member 2a protein-like [Lytechinus pictus]
MCYVIITIRSLFWTLLSVSIVLGHLVALMTSQWLLGEERTISSASNLYGTENTTSPQEVVGPVETYTPTLGIFMRCAEIFRAMAVHKGGSKLNEVECTSYINNFMDLPSGFWRAMVIFYAAGFLILTVVGFLSVFSLCFRSLCKKSLFTVCGFIQAIAGMLFIDTLC